MSTLTNTIKIDGLYYYLPKSIESIKSVRDWALGKTKTNPDLIGLSALVSDKVFEVRHSEKKTLALTIIAVAMGMYRP